MTDRRRNGFHGDPILVEEGPFCKTVSRSASSLKLCLQTERKKTSIGGKIQYVSGGNIHPEAH